MNGIFGTPICWHAEHTEPDADGNAICASCGSTVPVTISRATFLKAAEHVRRAGRHSMRCVETAEGEWFCAPDCPSKR